MPDEVVPGPTRKAFAELGLALRVARRNPALRDRADVARLVRWWLETLDAQDMFFDIENRLGLLSHCAALLACAGDLRPPRSPLLRRRLQIVLDRGYCDRIERNGWNGLDLHYYFAAAGLRHELPPAEILLGISSLVRRPPLPYAHDIDLYAITHIVFDLADFGRRDPRPALGAACGEVAAYLRGALALCLAERNWDLCAEFLMCRLFLRDVGELDRLAAAQIVAAQDPRGFVPRSADVADPATRPMDRQLFDDVNHTSIVGLLLAAADWSTA